MHRLRELDQEVELLRTALAALQRQLSDHHAGSPAAPTASRAVDEYLRAYA